MKKIILGLITLFLFSCSKPALEIEKDTEKAKAVINECVIDSTNKFKLQGTDYAKYSYDLQAQMKNCFKSKGYDFTKTLKESLNIKKIENFKYANSLIFAYREARRHGIQELNNVYSKEEMNYIKEIYKSQQNFGTWIEENDKEKDTYYFTENPSNISEGYDLKVSILLKENNISLDKAGYYFFDGNKLTLKIDNFIMSLPLEKNYEFSKPDKNTLDLNMISNSFKFPNEKIILRKIN